MLPLFLAAVSTAATVIALAGLGTLGWGLHRARRSFRSRGWPSVRGEVVSATVEMKGRDEDDDPKTFRPAIRYRYEVSGVWFENDVLRIDDFETGNASTASDVVRAFPSGTHLDVFYEPAKPSNSVLRPGISGASLLLPSIGLGLVALGLSMLGIAWKMSEHFAAR